MEFIAGLSEWGYFGLFIAAFLAGSIIPFSSEAVLGLLLIAGYDSWGCVFSATLGNWLGGVTCYYIGYLGKTEWIHTYLKIPEEKLSKMQRFLKGKGSLFGFFVFIPVIGDIMIVALGLLRANPLGTLLSMMVGKFSRYYLVVIGINYLKGVNMLKPESYYYVEFTDINGLANSSPVFANGLKVGLVRDIQYNYQKPGHVVVGIDMDEKMRIPKGSYADLVTEMLGTVKINLVLDFNSTTYYAAGDTIQGRANPGIMGVAEKELLPKVEQMMPKLDSILSSLNQLLADPALKNTLHNAEQLTASLNATSKQLNTLMSKDVPALTGNITTITEDLKQISGNLKNIDYASTFIKVDSTLQNVRLLTDKLNRKDNSLGLLLNDSSLYNNLSATAGNAASLLEDLQAHPKRYVHFSLFGKKDK